jgi:2-polyprenyl-3-methyl-5-hydroxy-6-metoxy-1,4-benzoquinol methylase
MISLERALDEMVQRGKFAEEQILLKRPDLLDLFFTYQNEALAARKFLHSSLLKLDNGAQILEIGGGILALATQLASEGFKVSSVEPIGEGFSGIAIIMQIFSEIMENKDTIFELIETPIEDYEPDKKFDFIFSVNVMEHLKDPYSVLLQSLEKLEPGGEYRFICPNYDFPYEPHFGKFLYRRSGGSFVLPLARATHHSYKDSEGLFNSINWITVKKIRHFSKKYNFKVKFNRYAFGDLLVRAFEDELIRKRHPILATLLKPIAFLRISFLASLMPVEIQPTMDVSLEKSKSVHF